MPESRLARTRETYRPELGHVADGVGVVVGDINRATKSYIGQEPFWFNDERVTSNEHAADIRRGLLGDVAARWDAGDASVLDVVLPWPA